MNRIYLDNCATTAMAPEVCEAITRVMAEVPGNPGSIHHEGRQAAHALASARETVANSLGARPAEIVFTSSGTEANNLAIGGAIARSIRTTGRASVITSDTEHASVSTRLRWEKQVHGDALRIVTIGVNREGALLLDELDALLTPDTTLVALLLVNNETGVVQNLDALKARKLRHPNVLWLLDAVQAQGKIPLDVRLLPFDFLSLSAHKIYGPKGIGALFVRGGAELDPLLLGGSQEKFRRAGTENLLGAIGFAEAVRLLPPPEAIATHLRALEDALFQELASRNIFFQINGPMEPGPARLPGFVNLSFDGVSSREDLQIALDLEGVSLSSTSACHSGVSEESHVLAAMGIGAERRSGAIRILFSRYHTPDDAREAGTRIAQVVRRIACPIP